MAWKVARVAIVSVLITTSLWVTFSPTFKLHKHRQDLPPQIDVPRYEAWGIRDLRSPLQISSIHIKPEVDNYQPPLKQDVDLSFSFAELDITQPTSDLAVESVTVRIAKPEVPDASSLLVGLATTLGRLKDALPAFSVWASKTRARFIVVIGPPKQNEPSSAEIMQLYTDHNIPLTLIESTAEWYDQYVSLLAVLYDHANNQTEWACIMDDDTFFFSMKRVLDMLARYDSTKPHYIGGLSENKDTMDRLGYLAYGGAGVFFSVPLLKELRPHVDDCIALPDPAGDIRVSSCIYDKTETKLTWEHHLFQMDMHGDVTGFYEAARTRPISTHHWKTWHFQDMVLVGAVSQICGNECILQKYQFSNGYMMTNGFSIVKYSYTPKEEAKYVPVAMEHTWADTAWVIPTSWTYTLAPLKPKDEGKIQYLLEKVEHEEGGIRLYYVQRKHGLGEGIIQVFWEKLA